MKLLFANDITFYVDNFKQLKKTSSKVIEYNMDLYSKQFKNNIRKVISFITEKIKHLEIKTKEAQGLQS